MVAIRQDDPLTAERARELFNYDPISGDLTARIIRGNTPAGYIYPPRTRIKVDGLFYKPSRLAWLIHYGEWPMYLVDHEDGATNNNKLKNLRDATPRQNQQNLIVTTGKNPPGVTSFVKRGRTYYMSKIRIPGQRLYLGCFSTSEAAAEAYRKAKRKYHGEFSPLR